MKKICLFAMAVSSMWACSSDDLVSETAGGKATQTPIGFSVQKQNITRGNEANPTELQNVNHFNFGTWAYKIDGSNGLGDTKVMDNYLVGYSDEARGYNHENATTYATSRGTLKDHLSPWFYEGLGTKEYKDGNYGYKVADKAYMSNNANQYLRYWDLAYTYTNFYAYAPYVNNDGEDKQVTFNHVKGGTSTMTFAANTIRDGYDNTVNTAYEKYDRSLSEFMYAGVKATNANLEDVVVPFKHMGAQVGIRFYEDIPGYKVEIINLGDDHGKMKTGDNITPDMSKGIQLTPAVKENDAYTPGEYYTTSGATVEFTDNNVSSEGAIFAPNYTSSTKVSTPLMFDVPNDGLTEFQGLNGNHQIIKEASTSGTSEYSTSPTIYWAVAQPMEEASEFTKTGFTIHVSYRIIAEDNKEMITVHNATVHIPYKDNGQLITIWQPNTKYTYTFKITKNTSGTTNPGEDIDPTDPTPSDIKALFPIVFDQATIEEYTPVEATPEISKEGTTKY